MYKPVVLVILDGWGIGKSERGNAIAKANLPTINKLNEFYPHTALQASGISVGLPWGEVGNSEVGHITLGAGKIIYQSMPRITMDIQTGQFFKNPVFLKAAEHVKTNNSALHLMGLIGKGGVHSYIDHVYALLEFASKQKVEKVYLHVFTDGRDSPPTSGVESIMDLQKKMKSYGIGKIATISGRYFAMDRNENWDRVSKAYEAMVEGKGEQINDPIEYMRASYAQEITDEYLKPGVVFENGQPVATIQDKDAVIFFNFREDRARQITKAFVLPGFSKFPRKEFKDLGFVMMTQYEESIPADVAFPPVGVKDPLGSVISQMNMKQLRISETEKFAHVTYFFNGGREDVFPNEDRVIIPSKPTDSFDKIPEMSAREITDRVVEEIKKDTYSFILINYANADIVGHTSNETATIKAVEVVDECLGKLIREVLTQKGCLLITADHGNAEELQNIMTGEKDTEHSANPVPLWFVTADNHHQKEGDQNNLAGAAGLLSDIAPTILDLLEIQKPQEMTGESLLPILK